MNPNLNLNCWFKGWAGGQSISKLASLCKWILILLAKAIKIWSQNRLGWRFLEVGEFDFSLSEVGRVKPARPTRTRASRKSSVWIIARAPVRTNFRWTLAKQLAPLLRPCVEDVARTWGQCKSKGKCKCKGREWRKFGPTKSIKRRRIWIHNRS